MALARPLLSLTSLLLLAGGTLLQLLVILSGAVPHNPITQIYFLQAATTGITPAARNPSRWTFFAICGVDSATNLNANCGAKVPALPFDPKLNFDATGGLPAAFASGRGEYYTSRAMFGFYLLAVLFAGLALLLSGLAVCTRMGAFLSGVNAAVACVFQMVAAALMTVWTVKGRNGFRAAGLDASLGVKAFAFTWAAVACFFLSTLLFCLSGAAGRDRRGHGASTGKSRFGRRQRSTRSTRSERGRGSLAKEFE